MRSDSVKNEGPYIPEPEAVEDLIALRRAIIDAGHSPSTAAGLVGWLVAKAAGDPDTTGPSTRSNYRKILDELKPVVAPPPDRPARRLEIVEGAGKGSRRRVRGGGKLASVVALALVSVGVGTQVEAPRGEAAQVDRTEQSVHSRRFGRRGRKAA
ncbi:MAG TPA: hypothetical protein VGX21_13220 [Methylomirabilota bacterium]|jgi:hypothetical protein|nr:hypothetical protein [Methylomirabilota bacterium]